MERIKGVDTDGNYLYEGDGQLDQEIQKVTNENFFDMISEDSAMYESGKVRKKIFY